MLALLHLFQLCFFGFILSIALKNISNRITIFKSKETFLKSLKGLLQNYFKELEKCQREMSTNGLFYI